MFPYTINNAVDYLLKQEFDLYRERQEPHPIMLEHEIDAVPFQHEKMGQWRHNFTGIQYDDVENDFHIFGAVDDIWVGPNGELIVVDYKATGANQHKIWDSYQRQMEIYQWLLEQNGFNVSPLGYFLFAKVNKGDGFSDQDGSGSGGGGARLSFDLFLESARGETDWVPLAVKDARKVIDDESVPTASDECKYCSYRKSAAEVSYPGKT